MKYDEVKIYDLQKTFLNKGYDLIFDLDEAHNNYNLISGLILESQFKETGDRTLIIKGMTYQYKNFCGSGSFFGGCYWNSSMVKSATFDTSVLIKTINVDSSYRSLMVKKMTIEKTIKNRQLREDIEYRRHGRFNEIAKVAILDLLATKIPFCR